METLGCGCAAPPGELDDWRVERRDDARLAPSQRGLDSRIEMLICSKEGEFARWIRAVLMVEDEERVTILIVPGASAGRFA